MAETNSEATNGKRIVFIGGSGKVGSLVIQELLKCGHQILNLDLAPLKNPDVHTIKTDITQCGQVFNNLTSQFKITQPFERNLPEPPDAVIHFAGHPRTLLVSDDETFRVNAVGTYNVIEAACKLGVKKIIIASSVTTYGVTYANGDVDYPSFPIVEDIDVDPMDTYAISKVCGERTAKGFARRFGVDIYVLRLGNVVTPDEYSSVFNRYVNDPPAWKGHGWSYTDVRDLGQMCNLCVAKNGHGFQIFNATNDHITNNNPTMEFLKTQCPHTPFTRDMETWEAPISNRKMKEMLGFREEFGWRSLYYGQKS